MRRLQTIVSTVAIAIVLALTGAALSAQAPPASVTGPIPQNAPFGDPSHDFIQSPSAISLADRGYVEEEFFIQGTANRYTNPELATGEIIDGGHPYTTRLVVRRPTSAAAFNGTVIIEWNNVTAGRDLDIDWFQAGDYFVREGYAWVGVSAQRVGVDYLREWSPTRYGSLDVTHDGMIDDDALSYDIFSAVGRAARAPGAVNFMGELRPERVIATGHSQSASRLATYLNHVHPRDPVYDAVMVHGGGGQIRYDQAVKIFRTMAETDMPRRALTPQPDSGTFRQWEVAGTSHVDVFFRIESSRVGALESGRPHVPFDAATLAELYPSHEAYVDAVKAVVARNLDAGYILAHDADATIQEAERSAVGRK